MRAYCTWPLSDTMATVSRALWITYPVSYKLRPKKKNAFIIWIMLTRVMRIYNQCMLISTCINQMWRKYLFITNWLKNLFTSNPTVLGIDSKGDILKILTTCNRYVYICDIVSDISFLFTRNLQNSPLHYTLYYVETNHTQHKHTMHSTFFLCNLPFANMIFICKNSIIHSIK